MKRVPWSSWPLTLFALGKTFGFRGSWLRAVHEVRRVTGLFARQPHTSVGLSETTNPLHIYRVNPDALAAAVPRDTALERAGRVLGGEYQAFRHEWKPFPPTPNDWSRHAGTGKHFPQKVPWWKVPFLSLELGDIKDIWEPARFAWAYDLTRAFVLTRDDRYAEYFFSKLEQWVDGNPPYRGAHWACGQEVAIRSIALLHAEANLVGAPAATAKRLRLLREVLLWSSERIDDAIGYGISQRNNHGISEATGLLAVAVRFRETDKRADRWIRQAHRTLERMIREQFADDGWYVQHSFVYTRLALEQCVISAQALRMVGLWFGDESLRRLRKAHELLCLIVDAQTGIVPNHGASDGSFVYPVTTAEYRDFRPVLSSVAAIFGFAVPEPMRVDREVLAWLGVDSVDTMPPVADGVYAGSSGWAVGRVGAWSVFLRAGCYKSRPGHIDSLHLDVRHGSVEVIVDPGTFAYNAPEPWNNGLAAATVHNGPIVNGNEPGLRGPRFLWLRWPRAAIINTQWNGTEIQIEAVRPGAVRRTVRVTGSAIHVSDQPDGAPVASMQVRWIVAPDVAPDCVMVEPLDREGAGQEGDGVGWFSPHYGHRISSHFVEARHRLGVGDSVVTVIRPPVVERKKRILTAEQEYHGGRPRHRNAPRALNPPA